MRFTAIIVEILLCRCNVLKLLAAFWAIYQLFKLRVTEIVGSEKSLEKELQLFFISSQLFLRLLKEAWMCSFLKYFSLENFVALAACNLDVRAIHFQMQVKVFERFERHMAVFANFAHRTSLLDVLVQLKNFHLHLNWSCCLGLFLTLWVIWLEVFRPFLANMCFSQVSNLLSHLFGDLTKVELFFTWGTLWVVYLFEIEIA